MNPSDRRKQLIAYARQSLGIPPETPLRLTPLTKGGSDRTYYRLECTPHRGLESAIKGCSESVADCGGKDSVIAMHYNPDRKENTLYADIAVFMQSMGVAVPRILAHDPEAHFLVMEDLGEKDLWSYRNEPWTLRRNLYAQALIQAHRLHRHFRNDRGIRLPELMEGYDKTLYLWERQYFREEFLEAVCGITLSPAEEKTLEEELAGLADRMMASGTGLVHRDLQSQNIMIHQGVPVLIDFQGLRLGSPFYDLGSLLYDPYVSLTTEERLELLEFYYGLSPQDLEWPDFVTLFHEGSAQRLMQALGAYGFLGHRNGRADFLAHIPAGLRHLLDTTSRASSLPHLQALTVRCLDALNI